MTKIDFLKTIPNPSSEDDVFNGIFTVNGRLCVTERHILFLTDRPEGFNDELPDGTHKVKEIYKPSVDEFKKYSVKTIRKEYNKLPLVDEVIQIDCEECDGYGVVEYTYEAKDGTSHEINGDCPECNGRGSWDKKTGNKVRNTKDTLICINHFNFEPNLFGKIVNVPNCPETIELMAKDHKLYFRAGELDGVLMGIMGDRGYIIKLNHD